MGDRAAQVEVTLTEMPQYRRLVKFLEAVHAHAVEEGDEVLHEMVADCRDDLMAARRG